MQLIEPDYLPFLAGDLPRGPWLILAPHPDDETFGMGGSIRRAADSGISVTVIVLTDGALGGGKRPDLVAIRQKEARHAGAILGLADIEFWNQPDRALEPTPRLVSRLSEWILQQRPRALFFPSITEPHPDHRAAAIIGWEAARQSGFWATPIAYEISSQGPINLLLDVSDSFAAKTAAMAIYASQEAERPYCKRVIAQNVARTWSLPETIHYAEAFLILEATDAPLADIVLDVMSVYAEGLSIGQSNTSSLQQSRSARSGDDEAGQTLSDQLSLLLASRSWRWTEPLRRLSSALRRVFSPE